MHIINGDKMGIDIRKHIRHNFKNADVDELAKVEGMNMKAAEAVKEYFANKDSRE